MKTLAIAATDLRRLFRWRANVFFLFVLPMLIILLLGAAFGSASARIGVVDEGGGGPLAGELVDALERAPNLDVELIGSVDALADAVSRGRVPAGVVVPPGYDSRLRSGQTASLRFLARPDSGGLQLRATVESVVAAQGARLRAARALEREGIATGAHALELVDRAGRVVRPVGVRVAQPDGTAYPESSGRFDESASAMLLLFVFLNSLNGAIWLIQTRSLGVSRRMLSTPTSIGTILAGTALGRFSVALVQALLIMVGSLLLFGVNWGDPVGAVALAIAFCLVGTGAAMLLGAVASTEEQAGPLALLLGLVLAALGGCMVPLEVFPETVKRVAHLTPHAWGIDGYSELIRHGGRLADVLPELGVLLGFAVILLALASYRLRRAITA